MKPCMLIIAIMLVGAAWAVSFTPEVHSVIMLDAHFYSGEAANDGVYDTTNRYQVRKAAFSLEGTLQDNIRYAMEAGVATCVGSGDQLRLMDASLLYRLTPNISVGVQQGHILRGFSAITECPARLGLEKPVFATAFGACHPLGAIVEGYFELDGNMGLQAELALLNGVNGTLDGEHEYNIGLIFETPLPGLSVGGSYDHVARQYYDEQFSQYSEDGYRAVAGVNYQNHGLWVTGEYYTGESFERDDQTMDAWYAQAGYDIATGWQPLPTVQPYAGVESWDKDTDTEALYQYVEAGLNLKLSAWTKLRCAYRTLIETPDGVTEEPSGVTIRLQTGF